MRFKKYYLLENEIVDKWHNNSVNAENEYKEWLKTYPEATKEIDNIIKMSKNIKDQKSKSEYLKREKREFDKKYLEIYNKIKNKR